MVHGCSTQMTNQTNMHITVRIRRDSRSTAQITASMDRHQKANMPTTVTRAEEMDTARRMLLQPEISSQIVT